MIGPARSAPRPCRRLQKRVHDGHAGGQKRFAALVAADAKRGIKSRLLFVDDAAKAVVALSERVTGRF